MKRTRSITWRLQFWYGILLAVVLAGFGLTAYMFERSALVRTTDAELERRIGSVAREVRQAAKPPGGPGDLRPDEPPPEGPPEDDPGREPRPRRAPGLSLAPRERQSYAADAPGGWYYILWLDQGRQVIRSPKAPADVPMPRLLEDRPSGPVLRARGDIREACMPLKPGDVALVGRILTEDFQQLRQFAWLLGISAVAILALGLLGGYWLVSRSLRPIAEISRAAARIAAGNLGLRIQTDDTESELGELTRVLNDTFGRLEASFVQQTRFTADAAHELRTPVAVLLTHTQNALAVACPSETHQEAFEACQRAAQRMRSLIEALLTLARLDSGERTMRRESFDLSRLASESLGLVRPLAERRGITVESDLAPTPCVGDPGQIDQVIMNLVTNAIHHNVEKGRVRVTTRTDCGCAVFAVSDSGPGIAQGHLSHVFERFYRADASRSRSSGGTGLGLAIAKAIVEAHGGSIRAESRKEGGAVFTVVLPAAGSPG